MRRQTVAGYTGGGKRIKPQPCTLIVLYRRVLINLKDRPHRRVFNYRQKSIAEKVYTIGVRWAKFTKKGTPIK